MSGVRDRETERRREERKWQTEERDRERWKRRHRENTFLEIIWNALFGSPLSRNCNHFNTGNDKFMSGKYKYYCQVYDG